MKKLMTTMLAVAAGVGLHAVGMADTGTSFEGLTGDAPYDIYEVDSAVNNGGELTPLTAGETYWATNGTETLTVVAGTSVGVNAGRPDQYKSKDQYNYLSIKTTLGNPVTRYVSTNHLESVNINTGYYFDSLVKFTAFDDDQPIELNGGKLAIWLKEVYGNGDNADPTGTNLVITAGYLDANLPQKAYTTNYVCTVDVDLNDGAWHRVTVKAIDSIYKAGIAPVPGFVVFIDKKRVVCGDDKGIINKSSLTDNAYILDSEDALFPSADQISGGKLAIAAVQFDGQGDVDDLVFTSTVPFDEAKDAEFFAINLGEHVTGVQGLINGEDLFNISAATSIVYADSQTVQILANNVTCDTGWMFGSVTNEAGSAVAVSDAYTTTAGGSITVTAKKLGATLTDATTGNPVGDGTYESLAAAQTAINALGSGNVKLTLNDASATGFELDNANVSVILDLAGNNITAAAGSPAITLVSGTLLVTNSTETVGQVNSNGENAVTTAGGDALTIAGGIYNGAVDVSGATTKLITGGSFSIADNNNTTTKTVLDAAAAAAGNALVAGTGEMAAYYIVQEALSWTSLLGDPVDGAYTIDDTADLLALQRGVLEGLATSNVTFKQTANIDMTGVEGFWGIGWFTSSDAKDASITASGNIKFEGVYDGNNKTLSNVTIVRHNYAGIFNCIENATIRDLTVSNVTFSGTCSEEGFAVVGNAYTGCTIANVTSAGTWPAEMRHNAAGIVVRAQGNTTISGCVNNVALSTTSKRLGGILAFAGTAGTVSIQNCTNNATVVSTDGTRGVGGILASPEAGAGETAVVISGCADFGSETAGSSGYTGAIVGALWSSTHTYTDDGGNTFPAASDVCGYFNGKTVHGLAYAVDAGIDGFNYLTTVKASDLAAGNTYTLLVGLAPTFEFSAAGTIAFDESLTNATAWTGVTVAAGSGLTLTDAKVGNVTTFTAAAAPSGLDPEDGTTNVTVTAASESDAIAAAKSAIIVPTGSGATAAEYAELFTYSATGEGGTYNVAITGIQDSVVTGVSEEAVAVFSGDTAVAIPAGLYYRITPGTALPVSGVAQTGLSTGSVTVTKPGTTQGFLKVELSAIPFPQN